jgi:hypothetical protein
VDGDDAIAALARARAGGLLTSSWWAARAALLQQRLLARAAASQRATLVALHARALALHASSDAAPGDGSAADGRSLRRVAAAAHLEAALMEFEYRCAVFASLIPCSHDLTSKCPRVHQAA